MFEFLLQPALLLFTVPLLLALGLWLLGATGLLHDIGDAHDILHHGTASHDALPHDGDGHSVYEVLGFGGVPFSVIATLLLFLFGLAGIVLSMIMGELLREILGVYLANLLIALPSVLFSYTFTRILGRNMKALFRLYGKPPAALELESRIAIVSSEVVTKEFGSARLRLDSGGEAIIAVRLSSERDSLVRGQECIIVEYDREHHIYYVAPYSSAP